MLMEKRIGTTLILVENKDNIPKLNNILNKHSSIIIGRQGIPLRIKILISFLLLLKVQLMSSVL